MPVAEVDIERYAALVSAFSEKKEEISKLKAETSKFKTNYQTATKVAASFQSNLTRISTQICNCENIVDDLTELLRETEVPKELKRQIASVEVDSDEFAELLQRISGLLKTAKRFQDRGFAIGFEMGKELDSSVDKVVKKIVNKCSELLHVRKEQADWLEAVHAEIVEKAKFFRFVEEARPSALNAFFSKYAEIAGNFYYSCVKGYFSQVKPLAPKPSTLLIGTAVDDNGQPLGGITRRLSNLNIFSSGTTRPESQPASPTTNQSISTEFGRLMMRLFAEEFKFYKLLLESGHVKRKASLIKSFSKSFTFGKARLKELVNEISPTAALVMMSELSILEAEASEGFEIPTPSQWLSELQNVLFDVFKRQLRKQIDSLNSFPELKTSLTSSELHHHYVSKRFAQLLLSCLQTLVSFQRPLDLALVELKKLEQAYFAWAGKVATYVRDKKESTIFLLNNIDLVSRTCNSLAGADLNASLKFKFDSQMTRLVQLELETSFADLLSILSGSNPAAINQINADLSRNLKLRIDRVKSQSFLYFSNVEVGHQFRKQFCQAAFDLYSKYVDYFDRNFGKNALEQENDALPPDLNQIKFIFEE